MASANTPRVVVVGGATGTGKSELALDLADYFSAAGLSPKIVNADALQLYIGMNIGTAKLPLEQRRGYQHYLLDVLEVTEQATVSAYQRDARKLIDSLLADPAAIVILVGGTGLYINAVTRQLEFPGTDHEIRSRYEALAEVNGTSYLAGLLRKRDPAAAAAIGPDNLRRIVRALEVGEITGKPFATISPNALPLYYNYTGVTLAMPRSELSARLITRARKMWDAGLLQETRALQSAGLRPGTTAGHAIGYSQALQVLAGELTEAEAIEHTALATVRFAKRQDTWFRKMQLVAQVAAGPQALTETLEFLHSTGL